MVTNIGHHQISVTEWREDVIPSISGGGLDGEFVFHRAEIHWGRGQWGEGEAKSGHYNGLFKI